jgi:hypothetical protein
VWKCSRRVNPYFVLTGGTGVPPVAAVVPTGVAPDIQKHVELRRAKRAAAPDNMVKDEAEVPA